MTAALHPRLLPPTPVAPRLSPPLRELLAETCYDLAHADDLHQALLDEVTADCDPPCRLLAASLYALWLRPGFGDIAADLIGRVADALADVERGYISKCGDCCHPDDRAASCSHEIGCDSCDAHWQQHLDQALDQIEYALGDRAVADLHAVTG